jgi:hypothetical protein
MQPNLTPLANLINLPIKPEGRKRRNPVVKPLAGPIPCPANANLPRRYECEVFNFLWENREALGIDTVFGFRNLFVDGAVLLADGRRLAIEIKMRMNWSKALQAGAEFRRFLQTAEATARPVQGAIVFFETFKGAGWHRRAKGRLLENGWNHWYASHCDVEGHRADLFKLCGGRLESYGQAMGDAIIARLPELSDEGRAKVEERLRQLKGGGTELTPN